MLVSLDGLPTASRNNYQSSDSVFGYVQFLAIFRYARSSTRFDLANKVILKDSLAALNKSIGMPILCLPDFDTVIGVKTRGCTRDYSRGRQAFL